MIELLANLPKSTAFGTAGRQRVVESFSMHSTARAHEGLFLQLLQKLP
jgi:hypothetical protein